MTMLLYISIGGLLGTLARYSLQGWIQARSGAGAGAFPIGTLVINLAGSFVLGFVIRFATGSTVVSPEMRGALTIGFCGAFTTMSTFSYESVALLGLGQYGRAAVYMGGTIAGCLVAVIAGTALAERVL
jgi:CrcB protein